MNGGPSQVDTFDPKPELTRQHGKTTAAYSNKAERKTGGFIKSPFTFKKYGQAGIEVSEIFPEVGKCIDDICIIRSMHLPTSEVSLTWYPGLCHV